MYPCQHISGLVCKKGKESKVASTCNIIISWSLECCSDWQTMVAIDTQHLCPHNRADEPKACDGFLSAEIMLEARFCSTSTIFLQKSFFEFHFTNNYVLLLNNFFYWRIIALQYCAGFCHTSTWISTGIHMSPPSWPSLSSSTPPHPL